MYRRVVSLLLLPCLPLTQSAACGHHHHGREPAGHDLRPHVHLCHHTHQHQDAGHRHPHDAEEPDSPEPLHDHDCDAIYVTVDSTAAGRSQSVEYDNYGSFWLAPSPGAPFRPLDDARAYAPQWAHPPPLAPDCSLYLLHLSLLI